MAFSLAHLYTQPDVTISLGRYFYTHLIYYGNVTRIYHRRISV